VKDWIREAWKHISGRVVVLGVLVMATFYFLVTVLFDMQIVNGQDLVSVVRLPVYKTVDVAAPRGEIYDRFGRPLAVNTTAYVVKFDPSFAERDMGAMLHSFIKLMEDAGESVIYDLPISNTVPRRFLFGDSATREERWKKDMGVDENSSVTLEATPDEMYEYLVKYFMLDKLDLSPDDTYKTLALRCALFMNRYTLDALTVAVDVRETTCAALEERNQDFLGVYIDVDYLRLYPEGETVAHALGYIRGISSDQYADVKALGYQPTDLFGQNGIEKAFELQLRGTSGERLVSADNSFRRVDTEPTVQPVPGDNIYLTLDAAFTRRCYEIVENKLSEILVAKLKSNSTKEQPYTSRDVLSEMIRTQSISLDKVMTAAPGSMSYAMRVYLESYSGLSPQADNYAKALIAFAADAVDSGAIQPTQVVGVMAEQDIVTLTGAEYDRVRMGTMSVTNFLTERIEAGEITPQMTNLNPSTCSVTVVGIENFDVIGYVSYPSYDNNEFVNHFNLEYYYKQLNDLTTPMINRAFTEPRAPGSTFKMITAIAGLEENVITTNTTIYDHGTFTEVGPPYMRCWIGGGHGSHGSINVAQALCVSCNYFFYDTVYRFGNTKSNTRLEAIETLNKYMKLFGLNNPTGIEIEEYDATRGAEGVDWISSPSFKEYREKINYMEPSASQLRWVDGDTLATAIGQSYNTYTSATMAKYIATLANGGTRYALHMLDKIESSSGALLKQYEPVVEEEIDLRPETLAAIYEGMQMVLETGTAAGLFDDIPFKVAGKTGTAQQDLTGADHATFACFAPVDDPQIAIFVTIPFGNTTTVTAPAAMIAHDIIREYFALDAEPERAVVNNLVP